MLRYFSSIFLTSTEPALRWKPNMDLLKILLILSWARWSMQLVEIKFSGQRYGTNRYKSKITTTVESELVKLDTIGKLYIATFGNTPPKISGHRVKPNIEDDFIVLDVYEKKFMKKNIRDLISDKLHYSFNLKINSNEIEYFVSEHPNSREKKERDVFNREVFFSDRLIGVKYKKNCQKGFDLSGPLDSNFFQLYQECIFSPIVNLFGTIHFSNSVEIKLREDESTCKDVSIFEVSCNKQIFYDDMLNRISNTFVDFKSSTHVLSSITIIPDITISSNNIKCITFKLCPDISIFKQKEEPLQISPSSTSPSSTSPSSTSPSSTSPSSTSPSSTSPSSTSPSRTSPSSTSPSSTSLSTGELNMVNPKVDPTVFALCLINKIRAKHNIEPLVGSAQLNTLSIRRSRDLVKDYSNAKFIDTLNDDGIRNSYMAENIHKKTKDIFRDNHECKEIERNSYSIKTLSDIHTYFITTWCTNSTQRENMLNPKAKFFGQGIHYENSGDYYGTQLLTSAVKSGTVTYEEDVKC